MTHDDPTARLAPGSPVYLCIDLKSFYASVECVDRGLDPMTTDLVVADPERSNSTICLAVSPAMKAKGVRNRCRVFEIPPTYCDSASGRRVPLRYIVAPPRMQRYVDMSANVYAVYLQYVSAEDIHVYSIDECFLDVTPYLRLYGKTARELAVAIIDDVTRQLGLRATCGIGTNLYLAKVALDITAKHAPDFIGFLDEETYRRTLWRHTPLTDFWRVGPGTVRRLARMGVSTMEGITRVSQDLLHKAFGVDAELLLDHAWGVETATMADIKGYKASSRSLSSGQVLMRDYAFDEGLVIVKEMTEALCMQLSAQGVVAECMTLFVSYSAAPSADYGEQPAGAGGSASLRPATNVASSWRPEIERVYRRVVRHDAAIRRVTIGCGGVHPEHYAQFSLFDRPACREKERRVQQAAVSLNSRFGGNTLLRGMNLQACGTMRERNHQIGGHKSGE